MKTKVFIKVLVFFLLTIFTLVSCREEDPPKLEVEVKPTSVAYNGSATLTWRGENLASLKINEVSVLELESGSMPLNNLLETTTYNFLAVGLDGSTLSRSASVKVDKPVSRLIVTVTPSTVIHYKGSATVSWQAENLASLKINDVNRSELVNGSISLTNLVKDTTFNFFATGLDGYSFSQKAEIRVAEANRTDTLCGYKWGMVEWKYWYEGRYIFALLEEKHFAERWVFFRDGKFNHFNHEGKLIGNGNWSWVGKDSISLDRSVYRYTLTEIKMTLSEKNDSTVVAFKAYPF